MALESAKLDAPWAETQRSMAARAVSAVCPVSALTRARVT